MYTSQDTPSVSNKRVRLTLVIALIVIGSCQRELITIALDAKVSAFHAKWLRAVYGFRVHLNRVSIIVISPTRTTCWLVEMSIQSYIEPIGVGVRNNSLMFKFVMHNKKKWKFVILTFFIPSLESTPFFQKFQKLHNLFGISIENASKWVQTCLCLVQWFLRPRHIFIKLADIFFLKHVVSVSVKI